MKTIAELLQGLADGALSNADFRHPDHLRVAHYYLLRDGYPFALETVSATIRRFAELHGASRKFHATITECWVRLVAAALAESPGVRSFETLVALHPHLLAKETPLRHYTRERLFSDAARAGWLEPDLLELPRCPIHRGVAA